MRGLLAPSLVAGIIAVSSAAAAAEHPGWFVRVCPAKTEADRIHLTFSGGRQGFSWSWIRGRTSDEIDLTRRFHSVPRVYIRARHSTPSSRWRSSATRDDRAGFAEIAGSGLRILRNAWRGAHRPAPTIVSDREANNFTLTLDWRPLADLHDEFWHRLGVKLTATQAKLFSLVKSQPASTLEALSEASGLKADAVRADLNHLEFQRLLECHDGQYIVAEHLRDLI